MKKKATQLLAIFLTLCVLFALMLTGCGKDPDPSSDPTSTDVSNDISQSTSDEPSAPDSDVEPDSSEAPDSSDSSGTTTTTTTKNDGPSDKPGTTTKVPDKITIVNNCYSAGDKIAKDPVTFKVMIRDHYTGLAKYNDSAFAKYIKEKFNITLKFEVISVSAVEEKTSLAYAGSNLPDMFWGMAGSGKLHSAQIATKRVVNLSPYIEKYGPNIKAMLKAEPAADYNTLYDDGNRYMLPMVAELDNYSKKFFINKTWLKNLGLSMPTTTDELYDVLSAFKKQDANKNGKTDDEIPMIIAAGQSGVGQIPLSLFSPFGLYAYNDCLCIDQDTGKLAYAWTTEEYRDGLRYYRKLYETGLLYNAFRGATLSQIKQWTLSSSQTVGVIAADHYNEIAADDGFMNNYMLLAPFKHAGGKAAWLNTPYEDIWTDWFVLTNACKYPEIAVRLADWLYSTEGSIIALYGPPGANNVWNYDSKGNVVKNNNKVMHYDMGPSYPIPNYDSAEVKKIWKNATASNQTAADKAFNQQLDTLFKKNSIEGVPKFTTTVAEDKQLSANGDWSQYAINMQWNFIGGDASLDNDWNSYIKQMNKLGVQNLVSIKQKALNRYLVWLKNNK